MTIISCMAVDKKYSDHILKDIFRLFTLEELDEFASTKKKYKIVSLTEIILDQLKAKDSVPKKGLDDLCERAEVSGERTSKKEMESYKCAKNVEAVLEEYRHYCQEAEKKIFSPSARKKKRSRKIEMSKFILKERKKLEKANFKLKRQEIIKLYKESAKINLKRKKEGKRSKLDISGILFRKRV